MSRDTEEVSSTTEQQSEESQFGTAEFSLLVRDHQNAYIRVADNKASILLSGLVAYLGLSIGGIGSNLSSGGPLFEIAAAMSVLSAIIAISYAALAVYPSTPETPQGLIMWESITANEISEYRETIRGKDANDLLDELIDENYKLAEVNNSKYARVRRALQFTVPTILFGFIAMILLAI